VHAHRHFSRLQQLFIWLRDGNLSLLKMLAAVGVIDGARSVLVLLEHARPGHVGCRTNRAMHDLFVDDSHFALATINAGARLLETHVVEVLIKALLASINYLSRHTSIRIYASEQLSAPRRPHLMAVLASVASQRCYVRVSFAEDVAVEEHLASYLLRVDIGRPLMQLLLLINFCLQRLSRHCITLLRRARLVGDFRQLAQVIIRRFDVDKCMWTPLGCACQDRVRVDNHVRLHWCQIIGRIGALFERLRRIQVSLSAIDR